MEDCKEEQLQQELNDLIVQLQSPVSPIGDWKVAKYNEYVSTGLPAPYDIQELHVKRQAIRDRINELQEELKK